MSLSYAEHELSKGLSLWNRMVYELLGLTDYADAVIPDRSMVDLSELTYDKWRIQFRKLKTNATSSTQSAKGGTSWLKSSKI